MIVSENRFAVCEIMLRLPALKLRRLVAIIPPRLRDAAGKSRLLRREAEHVPVGDAMRGRITVRHPVTSRADDAIERAAGKDKFGPCLRRDDLLDQRIDDRIGDPAEIVRAWDPGGLRREVRAQ